MRVLLRALCEKRKNIAMLHEKARVAFQRNDQ